MATMNFKPMVDNPKRYQAFSSTYDLAMYINHRCPYCGTTMTGDHSPSLDHLYPKSYYLRHIRGIVPHRHIVCCIKCNNDKGDKLLDLWVDLLEKDNDTLRAFKASIIYEQEERYFSLMKKATQFNSYHENELGWYDLPITERGRRFRQWLSKEWEMTLYNVGEIIYYYANNKMVVVNA